MTESPPAATAPPATRLRLSATDTRRVPMLGIALGIAITAAVLGQIESGGFIPYALTAMWAMVAVIVLAVLPIANTLTLDAAGFRIRSLGVFSRFVPWAEVVSIEAGEGWAGATLIIELTETADRGFILGLPRDPELGRRTLVDSYGWDPEELARAMARHRGDPHP